MVTTLQNLVSGTICLLEFVHPGLQRVITSNVTLSGCCLILLEEEGNVEI